MKGTWLIIIVVVALVIIGAVALVSQTPAEPELVGGGGDERDVDDLDKAPSFTLEDYDGNTVSLSDSAGKIRVINSWATWCPFCVDELPNFARLQEEFPDEVVVISIDRAEPLEQAKEFTDEVGVTDRFTFLLDPKDEFYSSIGGFSMPETLFIDGEGNIRIHKRGPMRFSEMKQKVEQVLQVTKSN